MNNAEVQKWLKARGARSGNPDLIALALIIEVIELHARLEALERPNTSSWGDRLRQLVSEAPL